MEFFSNPVKMLSSGRIDAVLLETPPMHARQVVAALKNNVHVLSDVPVIHRFDEVGPLRDAAQNCRAIYMFGAKPNYFGFVQTCRDLLAKGLLGKPFYFEADYVTTSASSPASQFAAKRVRKPGRASASRADASDEVG